MKPELLRLVLAIIVLLVALRMALGLGWRPDEIYTVNVCEEAAALSWRCSRRCCWRRRKPRLVPDVSQREIEIRYSFTGAELLLFGAILYPGGRVPEPSRPTSRSC